MAHPVPFYCVFLLLPINLQWEALFFEVLKCHGQKDKGKDSKAADIIIITIGGTSYVDAHSRHDEMIHPFNLKPTKPGV